MDDSSHGHLSWARLRFSIIGPLLASPPERGQLQTALDRLAQKEWTHPTEAGRWVKFGRSTIEKWYYAARDADDPMAVLSRKVRSDRGGFRVISKALSERLYEQYRAHKRWSFQLHHDNLEVVVEEEPELGPCPSYATLCRYMNAKGWRRKKVPRNPTEGQNKALERLEGREVRSFERSHAHALWHVDFHIGSLKIVDEEGRWHTPVLMGLLDDCTRICLHLQWFHTESAHTTYHGLMQALLKWGLPRELMSDNGKAFLAGETKCGLERLGIVHETTLPYSAYQNGKQEAFWNQIEGRLLPMLESVEGLTLAKLNEMTLAWLHYDYNHRTHSELSTSPMKRLGEVKSVGRQAPTKDVIQRAFTRRISRKIRRSDMTITIDGVRFEVPFRLKSLERLTIRYAAWDLTKAWVVDETTDEVLATILPQDKSRNADGKRRAILHQNESSDDEDLPQAPIPPLMRKIMAEHAATGLPPAYIPLTPDWRKEDA